MVELMKDKYSVRVGVGVIDEYLVLESWSPGVLWCGALQRVLT